MERATARGHQATVLAIGLLCAGLIAGGSCTSSLAGRGQDVRIIRGTVRDPNGRPVSGATACIRGKLCNTVDATTGSDGKFTLEATSRWTLPEDGDRCYLMVRGVQHNLAVTVPFEIASKEDVAIKLARGITIAGAVTDEQGKAVSGTKLSLYVLPDRNTGYPVGIDLPIADRNGHYEIVAVPAVDRCTVHATAKGYNEESTDARPGEAMDGRLDCETLVLRLTNLDVSGMVVDVNDRPIPNASVVTQGAGQPILGVRTDAQGRFTIHGLCSRDVRIHASVDGPPRLSGEIRVKGGMTDVAVMVLPREP